MKKVMLLAVMTFVVVCIGLAGCSKNNDDKKSTSVMHNIVDGKQLSFMPTSNFRNFSSDEASLILVSGETYTFETYVESDDDNDGWWEEVDNYDCSGAVWTLSGNIGNFGAEEGKTSMSGKDVTIVITAASGAKGTLKIQLNSMIFSFPVKVVSNIED